ncbi:outer membrane beta-barrel protein [Acetobacter conturbans]|uniref:Outer membrane beta-barrel protein n=1 Tax=Acetobacter conturbans TaxID=1737472 RepID=A0ABX0JYN7_9PROT|nr:outer membrane beta-barrel protein [Acetobacter conturbans]NHN87583.1 outer membrane beta-barrel protein [Acetobacter conturbans]
MAVAPSCAHAQVVTQYFPSLGVGAGELSEEAAQVRATRSYQPLGYRNGPLTVNLDGDERIGYTTNADQLQTGHKSSLINTRGHIGAVRMLNHEDQVHADVSVSDLRYPSRSLENRTTWTANVGGTKHFGHDELGAAFTHLSLVQMPTESGALLILGPVPYNLDDGRVSYLLTTHGRLSFQPEVSVQHYYFGKPRLTGISPFQDQSYRDRVVINEAVTGRYQMMKNSHLLLVVQGTQIKYKSTNEDFPVRSSNGFSVLGGYSWNEAGPFQFRAVFGYQRRIFSSTLYGSLSSPIAQASVRWLPTRLTTVSASVAHGIEDAAFEGIVGYTNTSAELRVTHAYSRNIVFDIHGNLRKAHYPASPAQLIGTPIGQEANNQSAYGGGVSAHIYLNRHVSLDFNYDYMSQSAYMGPLFPTHLVTAGVHFAL